MRNRNSVKVRRDHKDTLFRMIFSTRENLLSLYNAVNHSQYGCKRVGDRDAGKCGLYEYEK